MLRKLWGLLSILGPVVSLEGLYASDFPESHQILEYRLSKKELVKQAEVLQEHFYFALDNYRALSSSASEYLKLLSAIPQDLPEYAEQEAIYFKRLAEAIEAWKESEDLFISYQERIRALGAQQYRDSDLH